MIFVLNFYIMLWLVFIFSFLIYLLPLNYHYEVIMWMNLRSDMGWSNVKNLVAVTIVTSNVYWPMLCHTGRLTKRWV